jgi:cytochrome c oxidase subunit 2
MQLPAFDESKYKFFDVNWDAPMNTISGITEWSRDINNVYGITTWICIFVFFAVAIPLVWTLVKFKDKGDGTVPKQFHGNATLEILWTVIPVVLLLFIAVPTWRVLFKHSRAPENAMVVEVIGHQWWWEFRYPQNGNIITANELHLPEKTPIHFKVWSEDVIHGFWVPKFGGKMDANPTTMNEDGSPKRYNDLYFETPAVVDASKRGGDMYQGQCTQLCGPSHALMRFNAVVHTKEEFDVWTKNANTPPKVETALAKAGEQVFARCQACHAITGTPSADIPGKKIGPNLTNFGDRKYLGAGTRLNTRENLAAWLRDPTAVKPGALMPAGLVNEEEIMQVSSYLRLSTSKALQ